MFSLDNAEGVRFLIRSASSTTRKFAISGQRGASEQQGGYELPHHKPYSAQSAF